MSDNNKTVKDFYKYFAGDLFVKGFMFISLPLLSRVLDPIDYGKMSLLNAAVMILYVFISLNLQNAVINAYMKNDVDFPRYLGTIIIGLIPIQIIILMLLSLTAGYIAPLLSITKTDLYWVMFICIMLSYIYIYTSYLQGARLSSEFVKINASSKILEVLLIFIIALLLHNEKYLSKAYAQIAVGIFLLLYVAKKFKKIAVFKFDYDYFKIALFFSVPLILHVLSNSLLSQADRLIISRIMDDYYAGIYSFAYNLGMCIIVVVMAWNASWQPKLYNLIQEQDSATICKAINNSCIIVAALSFLAMSFSHEAVLILAGSAYAEASDVVPVVIFGNALIHIYLSYVNFTFFHKKTFWVSIGTFFALVVNIALNYLLIPHYGIMGAAWATVGAYFLLALFQFLISKFIVRDNPLSIALLIKYSLSFCLVLLFINEANKLNIYCAVALKLLIMLFIVAMVVKFKVYDKVKV